MDDLDADDEEEAEGDDEDVLHLTISMMMRMLIRKRRRTFYGKYLLGVKKILGCALCLNDLSNSVKRFEHLKGTNGVAPNGVLWGGEDPVDQLGRFSLVASLHDRTHRFCASFVNFTISVVAMTYKCRWLKKELVLRANEDDDNDNCGDYVDDDDSRKWLK